MNKVFSSLERSATRQEKGRGLFSERCHEYANLYEAAEISLVPAA